MPVPPKLSPISVRSLAILLLLGGTMLMAQSPPMKSVRVSEDRRGFILDDANPFVAWGFNYDHDEKGRLLEDRHFAPYGDYCRHCDTLYRRVLEPLGYQYIIDMSRCDEAACELVVTGPAAP